MYLFSSATQCCCCCRRYCCFDLTVQRQSTWSWTLGKRLWVKLSQQSVPLYLQYQYLFQGSSGGLGEMRPFDWTGDCVQLLPKLKEIHGPDRRLISFPWTFTSVVCLLISTLVQSEDTGRNTPTLSKYSLCLHPGALGIFCWPEGRALLTGPPKRHALLTSQRNQQCLQTCHTWLHILNQGRWPCSTWTFA